MYIPQNNLVPASMLEIKHTHTHSNLKLYIYLLLNDSNKLMRFTCFNFKRLFNVFSFEFSRQVTIEYRNKNSKFNRNTAQFYTKSNRNQEIRHFENSRLNRTRIATGFCPRRALHSTATIAPVVIFECILGTEIMRILVLIYRQN